MMPAGPTPRLATSPATPPRRIPGDPEFWIFVFGDLSIFALFYSIWSVQRHEHPMLFAAGYVEVSRAYGVTNTLVLLTGSGLVAVGLTLLRRGEERRARWCYRGGAGLGVAFTAVKALEYGEHLGHHQTPASNDFFMYYFVFTGIHLVHVVVGTVALIVISRRADEPRDLRTVESVCVYWHMVDLVWLVWFYLIYIVR